MSEFLAFPSIEQFRHVIKKVQAHCKYHEKELPVINFTGRVKLHGTNAAIGYNPETKEIWAQSRSRVIKVGDDNAGFAAWLEENKTAILRQMELQYPSGGIVHVFGEWCGGNIQKGVALSGLPKMFVIFNVSQDGSWLVGDAARLCAAVDKVYNISFFKTFALNINFSFPERSVERLQKITEEVEASCPVGHALGSDGIGEGVVWTSYIDDQVLRFKVKGEKHSSSKVKVLAAVDIEKMESIAEFVDTVLTESRLEQGLTEVGDMSKSRTGDFVRWVVGDVRKEESDTMTASGLLEKDVNSSIGKKAAKWFLEHV